MIDESTRIRLKQSLANLDSLPAMPATAQKLLALPLDTDEGEAQMLKLIVQDPQISAKIISLANSPIMGVSRKLSTVSDAAMLLGLTRVKSVAVGIASMSHLAQSPAGKYFKPQDLWLHSMTVAIVMRTIAQAMPRNIRPNEDQIFLAGLLHDIGFMALHHIDTEASDALHHQLLLQPERSILEIELETLGITAISAHNWHGIGICRRRSLPYWATTTPPTSKKSRTGIPWCAWLACPKKSRQTSALPNTPAMKFRNMNGWSWASTRRMLKIFALRPMNLRYKPRSSVVRSDLLAGLTASPDAE